MYGAGSPESCGWKGLEVPAAKGSLSKGQPVREALPLGILQRPCTDHTCRH